MPLVRLKISISGVRGVVGETLTPQLLARFAQAFGTYLGPGRVMVGRDTRPSGQMVQHAVFAGLLSTGCVPVGAGVAPIPSLQYRCGQRGDLCGGVVITASHNPAEWNALKLLTGQGTFLSATRARELLDIYNQGVFRRAPGRDIPGPDFDEGVVEAHLDAVLGEVDLDLIRAARLRVAIDCVNGAGSVATPRLLERLGCQVSSIACQPSGQFSRPPEPLPEHLQELRELVLAAGAQVGFAQDADADRLAVVDEEGRSLEGDVMLALLVDLTLRRRRGPVVVNLSTSRLIEEVAARHGVPVIRTPVGEAHVVEAIQRQRAAVGGEGSGGLIYPALHPCRDSLIGMALLLEELARGGTVSALARALPPCFMIKQALQVRTSGVRPLLEKLRTEFADGEQDLRDGLRVTYPDRWFHLRPSNTEPLVRLIVEGPDARSAVALRDRVLEHAGAAGGQEPR